MHDYAVGEFIQTIYLPYVPLIGGAIMFLVIALFLVVAVRYLLGGNR